MSEKTYRLLAQLWTALGVSYLLNAVAAGAWVFSDSGLSGLLQMSFLCWLPWLVAAVRLAMHNHKMRAK